MMEKLVSSPLFGMVLCIVCFGAATWLSDRLRTKLANPLLLGSIFAILILQGLKIPLEQFNRGGDILAMLIAPATAALALPIHRQFSLLRKNWLPILVGCSAGALTAVGSVTLLCKMMRLEDAVFYAMLPKSVTTAIALELCEARGGIAAVTVLSTLITGVSGAVFAPLMMKLFRVKDPIAQGIALGTSSHAVGTGKAVELGEVQGAMSGIAIGITGLITVILALFF